MEFKEGEKVVGNRTEREGNGAIELGVEEPRREVVKEEVANKARSCFRSLVSHSSSCLFTSSNATKKMLERAKSSGVRKEAVKTSRGIN